MRPPIRLALPLIGRGAWTGGVIYLKNTLRLIRGRLADRIEPCLFLSPREAETFANELFPLVDGRLVVDPIVEASGRGRSLVRAVATGRDAGLEALLRRLDADVTFEVATFFGARFGLPVVAWLPDFQHRHMPEMFTLANWWRRDIGFRAQIGAHRTLMLSSHTARDDMERFYPSSYGRGHVVRFAIDLDVAGFVGRLDEMRAAYDLPPRFLFLPNQFWRHKNHTILIDALAQLAARGKLQDLPPIALSGLNKDPRHPEHFDALMRRVAQAGVGTHFRYLGLIPYEHVLALAGCCDALINPSLFEGWSTPIEEAKAVGAPLLLSDIAIHREQAPGARFFDPGSVDSVADALFEAAQRRATARTATAELVTAQNSRLDEHARSLLGVIEAAAGRPTA